MESETKFTHDSFASTRILRSLDCTCLPDDQYQSNIVNSIYFDTHDHRFAMEKAASEYLKTKIRLRWYQTSSGQESSSGCFLEFKCKTGSKRQKTRIALDFDTDTIVEDVTRMPVLQQIRKYIASNQPELSGFDLSPQILISYIRYRFIEPATETRIALDTRIKARSIRASFTRHVGEVRLNQSVLEVKGRFRRLPAAIRNMNGANLRKASFSKYYECFLLLTDYKQ